MKNNVIAFPAIDDAERRLIERAGAHSVEVSRLNLEARFRGGITDLDVARVILAVERGNSIRQSAGQYRWLMVGPEKMNRAFLVRVVDEMIRTGLAVGVSERSRHEIVVVHVRVAPVHFRARSDDLRASCHIRRSLRIRRTDDRDLVDCVSCLAIRR